MKTIPSLLFLLFVLLSCTSGDQPGNEITAWARPAAEGGISGAYFTYTNLLSVPDTLLKLDSNVAEMTQLHESYINEEGLSGMREIKEPVLKAGESLRLEAGGLHVMLMQLQHGLKEGDTLDIRLQFSQAGDTTLSIPVRNNR